MKPLTTRLHIKRLVIDRSALRGQTVNEGSLAAALDQAMRTRFAHTDNAPVNVPFDSVTSRIAEAIWRDPVLGRYRDDVMRDFPNIFDASARSVPMGYVDTVSGNSNS